MVFNKTTLACSLVAIFALNACTKSDPAPVNTPPTVSFTQSGETLIASVVDPDQNDTFIYTWYVDGGTYSGAVLPLTNPQGTKDVTLSVNDGTVTVIYSQSVFYNTPPTVSFDRSTNTFIADVNDIDTKDTLTYTWDVDGVKSTGPVMVLDEPFGVKDITLSVNDGTETVSYSETIDFGEPNVVNSLVAKFTTNVTSGNAPVTISFDASSSTDESNQISNYLWDFDSNGLYDATGVTTSYEYSSAGTYTVELLIRDVDGNQASTTQIITVLETDSIKVPPVAVVGASALSGQAPFSITFNGNSSSDSDGTITDYAWTINGENLFGKTQTYEFLSAGTYNVKLEVTDNDGLLHSDTVSVVISSANQAPVAVASASVTSGEAPLSVTFDGSGSTDDTGVVGYSWTIDGVTKNGSMVDHIFTTVGQKTVVLTVTDSAGLTHSTELLINVASANQAPVAIITASSTGSVGDTISITGSASTDDVAVVSYAWSIDGDMLTGKTISYDFDQVKTYTVTLTVSDAGGLTHATSVDIVIDSGEPIVRPVSDVLPEYDGVIPLIEMKGDPSASKQTTGNPFSDSYFYASPDVYHAINETSLNFETPSQNADSMYQKMKYTQRMPSAIWMDSIATISGNESRRSLIEHLDAALAQQQFHADDKDGGVTAPMLVVVIIYNLPDRDCAALASSGLLVEVGDDTKMSDPTYAADVGTGLDRYETDYIDVIASAFNDSKYDDLRIVAMLEPDSYPNMLTNQNPNVATDEYCIKLHDRNNDLTGESGVYVEGLRYAISAFADDANSNVYTYLDIGHSGWLGWDNNRNFAVNGGTTLYWNTTTESEDQGGDAIGFTALIEGAHPSGLAAVRGFASNTSGYTPLLEYNIEGGEVSDNYFEWNRYVDELHFMEVLNEEFGAKGFPNLGFIIDTARNGWGKTDGDAQYRRPAKLGTPDATAAMANRVDKRTHRGRWCNVMDAGVGESPQADPLATHPWIDAFYWMKPPGESDGASNPADANTVGKSYDPVCGGEGTPKTGMVPGRVIGNAAGLDTRTDTQDTFYAPTAGLWFDEQYRMLINNAYPKLGEYGDYSDYDYSTADAIAP